LTFASGTSFTDCEVTGVIEDFTKNSHIQYNFLISYSSLPDWVRNFWYNHEVNTFLLLSPRTNPRDIEARFPAMAEKYKTRESLKTKKWAIVLVPLDKVHLNPQKQYEKEIKGNRGSLITLIVIAIIIMLTAWINYINLTTARSTERTKDVGVRKVTGATRLQIIWQFLFESLLVNLEAIILATILALLLKNVFNQIIGENIGLFIFKQPVFWISTIAFLFIGILLSGFYPGVIMTRMNPSAILKESRMSSGTSGTTRHILVVFQFAASLFLICGTFIISRQVKYMQNQDLGTDISQTIVVKYPVCRENLDKYVELFAENLRDKAGIKSVTLTSSVPGMEVAEFASNRIQGGGEEQHRLYEMLAADDNYVGTFGLKLLAGRAFQKSFGNEQASLLVNEACLPNLGLNKPEDAIGKKILLEGEPDPATIIGVVKNWHQRGLENAYTPIMFLKNGRISWVPPKYIAIKTEGNNYDVLIDMIHSKWDSYFPEASFDYFFLDRFFDSQYKSDKRFEKIVSIFTVLAFFISVLGLWALSAFSASKRAKEMGVRKVFGAPVRNIIHLFLKEIIVLVLIAFLIATPISLFLMKNWLLNFAFRTSVPLWIYLVGMSTILLIALSTVCLQIWKTATRNPVEALRYE